MITDSDVVRVLVLVTPLFFHLIFHFSPPHSTGLGGEESVFPTGESALLVVLICSG